MTNQNDNVRKSPNVYYHMYLSWHIFLWLVTIVTRKRRSTII